MPGARDQVAGEHTRPNVGSACHNLGLIHAQACELDRERRLFPLVLGQAGNPQDRGQNGVEVLVELTQSEEGG